ncbi:hypothetical protein ACHQM5_027169 [Ranunculus cassubicifolius]
MGALSLLPLSISSLLLNHTHYKSFLKPQQINLPNSFKINSIRTNSYRKSVPFISRSNPQGSSPEFIDEDGIIEDMDGYMNHLSLEYDSVWDTKPSWCQPWTITLTGASVIACSWIILHSVVITTIAVSLIGAWWYIFLYSYPKAYTDMIAERRKKVNSGVEDTFGIKKS